MTDVQTAGVPGGGKKTRGTADVRGRLGNLVARRQILSFFVLAFVWTWGYDVLLYTFVTQSVGVIPPWTAPRAWGPLVAAVVVTWLGDGDLRRWASRVLDWRVRPRWFVLALLIPIAADELDALIAAGFGYQLELLARPAWQYVAHFLLVLLFAGALEEFGWRGFAQPRLQERYSGATAAIGIGVVWACWHLPLFVLFDGAAYDPAAFLVRYLPWIVALSALTAWLFNASGGSVLPAMVMHAANNGSGLLQVQGELQGIVGLAGEMAGTVTYGAVALVLIGAYGTAYVAPRGPVPAIPGFPDSEPDGEA